MVAVKGAAEDAGQSVVGAVVAVKSAAEDVKPSYSPRYSRRARSLAVRGIGALIGAAF